jgi:hypothetical protein
MPTAKPTMKTSSQAYRALLDSASFPRLSPDAATALRATYRAWVLDHDDKTQGKLAEAVRQDIHLLMDMNLAITGDPVLQEAAEEAEDFAYREAMQYLQIGSDADDEAGIAFWLAQEVTATLWFQCSEPHST